MQASDVNLGVGARSHAEPLAKTVTGLGALILERKPDLAMACVNVNPTLAAALVCAKLMVPVAHVEAGIRSYDRAMPGEVN